MTQIKPHVCVGGFCAHHSPHLVLAIEIGLPGPGPSAAGEAEGQDGHNKSALHDGAGSRMIANSHTGFLLETGAITRTGAEWGYICMAPEEEQTCFLPGAGGTAAADFPRFARRRYIQPPS